MCGRFTVTIDPALLAQKIDALDETTVSTASATASAERDLPGANYNVAPTTIISSVVKRHTESDDESTRRVRSMRWGLIPPWVKTAEDGGPDNKGPLLINARADKVTSSPAFRNSAKNKRCLIPMDGWYEWRPNPVADGKKASKTPFYMYGADGELLFMAGLWSTWRPHGAPKDAPPLLSCTIITTDAAGPLAQIHDRMPLTISKPDWDHWLDPDAPIDEGLLRGHGDLDRIAIREVSRLVNSVRNNGPELIEPAKPEAQEPGLF
ncbi:SOS response-associated peptidase [Mycobacterium sp. 141]|uniref:SOS response-associated peptidase n=1 Tax=Mycobacterium sp. 141 TaxID=1120797 RepID=UPI0018CB59FF|nr:SOS response-associated peptidase [Mycobacterium sp. 141]